MKLDIAEIAGFFLVATGLGLVVGACALIATWLAVLVAGVLVSFVGTVTVYVANAKQTDTDAVPGEQQRRLVA